MNNPQKIGPSTRFARIIGRKPELQRFERYLNDHKNNHVLFYWADGGYGKTRLLEELQEMVKELGPGYFSGGIIDLYHTASHGSSDVERLIINNLMRSGGLNGDKYFANYRRERTLFEMIRDRGADPGELEKRRASLSQVFINDFKDLALDAQKIVLCFDTIELIQYESLSIEEIVGLGHVDPRIRSWMLDKLPQLKNVLIVFAGRPQSELLNRRLIADMGESFGSALEVVQLPPFSMEETVEFFDKLPDGKGVLTGTGAFKEGEAHSENYAPLIYMLTGGRPILLHLVYDLLRHLSEAPRDVYALFDRHHALLEKYQNVPVEELDSKPDLKEARQDVEWEIIRQVINSTHMGGELSIISFLPKGVDEEIIQTVLGMRGKETQELIHWMEKLSFVKQHISEQGELASIQTQGERLFYHDEMYRLMTDPHVIPNIRLNERWTSEAIINRFYDRHIKALEDQIHNAEEHGDRSQRIRLRETRYKLLTERLYYMLERDPLTGYAEYKRLTAIANAERSTGFAMRVRDEFLRFYNIPIRTKQFEDQNISRDRVIKDSLQLWMERYHWGAFYDKAISLGDVVLNDPARFNFQPEDIDVLGNVCALWARAYAMKNGFDEGVLRKTQEMLDRMPGLDECKPNELLARGRLATSIGYLARWGGFFDLACEVNLTALASFRKLNAYLEEQAIVLNNLAYVSARRGQIPLARSYGKQAVKLNKLVGNEYSLGLSYTNLANVERIAGTNYTRAIEYATQAMELFMDIQDFHGLVRSYLNLGAAQRENAVEQMGELNLDLALKNLEEAEKNIQSGLIAAENGDLDSEIPGLKTEMGKLYRTRGRVFRLTGDAVKSMDYANQSVAMFSEALEWTRWSTVERADFEEDIAEAIFDTGDLNGAKNKLDEVRETMLAETRKVADQTQAPNWNYLTVGKIERLTSHIAMNEGRLEDALIGFATAYANFHLFSPLAVEKGQMLEHIFQQYLSDMPFNQLVELIGAVEWRLAENNCLINGVDVSPFISDLKELIGIR